MKWVALAGVLAVACGGSGKGTSGGIGGSGPTAGPDAGVPEMPAEPPPPPPPDGEGVALLEAGGEPRAVLRYDVKDKTKRKVDFEMKMGAAGTRKLAWTYDIKRGADGLEIKMKITKADPPLKGMSGTWRMSGRGRHEAPASDKSAQVLIQATQAEHMLPVFPAGAIGLGARWTAAIALSPGLGVAAVPGTTTWELKSIDGTSVTVIGALAVDGEDIPFRDATMDLHATGKIEATIDYTTLAGVATMELEMHSQAEGGKSIDYTATSTMRLK